MLNPNDIKLDWQPPAPERRVPSQPFRLSVQLENHPAFRVDAPLHNKAWKRRVWLDQGREGACTGFGAAHCLGIGSKFWSVTESDAFNFYHWAQKYDEWAGESYVGSSVHGAMAALKHQNIISGYWWAETLEELTHAVALFGAVDMGTSVYTGWFSPNSTGTINNSGVREGGHSYSVAAIDLTHHRARIDQSWGRNFGVNGSVWLDLDLLGQLLVEEGSECALMRKNMYQPTLLTAPLVTPGA